jgi:cell division initiation protein
MAINAREIEGKEFTVSILRGYKMAEVDDYLDELSREIERLQAENRALEAEIEAVHGKEKRVSELEQTLRDTLLTAQRAAEDVLRASKEKAAAMIKDSELEGRRIVEDAERQSESAAQRLEGANRDVAGVKALIRRILGEQLRLLDESYPDSEFGIPAQAAKKPAPASPMPTLADFDRTQEFSVRDVRDALEEERGESQGTKETAY